MPIEFIGKTEEYHEALVAALAEHDNHLITVQTGSDGTDTAFVLWCAKCDDVMLSARPGSGPKSEAQPPPNEATSAD